MRNGKRIKRQILILTFLMFAGICTISHYMDDTPDSVILNEVCCFNDTIIYNTVGKYCDYIELYNPTSEQKNISGYGLSDDKSNFFKYTFPENTILEAGEYLFLWAESWTGLEMTEKEDTYIGFSLKAGETLYLSDADGRVIEKILIPLDMERDLSYSRNGNTWVMAEASPSKENCTALPEEPVYLSTEIIFSEKSGFYDAPFYLEISTDEAYEIYYTLDGSTPTTESLKYENPIYIYDATENSNVYSTVKPWEISLYEGIYIPTYNVDKATIVRAIAVDEEGRVTKDVCGTYFVGFQAKDTYKKLSTISIITDPENLFDYETGIYMTGAIWGINRASRMEKTESWRDTSPTNYTCEGKGWRRDGILHYFDSNQNFIYDQRIELGIHGNTSCGYVQKGFNLYAVPDEDGKEYIFEGLFDEKESSLMLRTGGFDWDKTKLRDALVQELVGDRALVTLKYEPCQVFIDGEYWGVYMLQERCDASMISSKYSIEEENVIMIKNSEVVAGDEEELKLWEDVITYATTHDLSLQWNYERMEQMIDIQSCIDHYCFQLYVANVDSFGNNYVRWRTRDKEDNEFCDGKWRWIVCDIDASVGLPLGDNLADMDSFIEGNWYTDVVDQKLFAALIKNQEFKERFVTSFMDMANYNFDAEKVCSRIDELAEQQCEAMVAFQKRFWDENYSEADYMEEIDVLKTFYDERYAYITQYMKQDLALLGELVEVTVKNSNGGQVKLNTLTIEEAEEFTGKYYSDYCIELSVETFEGYKFQGWDINGVRMEQEKITLELDEEYVVVPCWEKNM